MSTTLKPTMVPDRLCAVDLRDLSEEKHAALRREAIRMGISISELLARLIEQASERLTGKEAA